jgi:hypothetical protein
MILNPESRLLDTDCKENCQGNKTQKCGDADKTSLYKIGMNFNIAL